jgi:hypothetical protein
MHINYSELKAKMTAAGYEVSEGLSFLASDLAAFADYSHFTLGMPAYPAMYALSAPALVDSLVIDAALVASNKPEVAAVVEPKQEPVIVHEQQPAPVFEPEQEPVIVDEQEPAHVFEEEEPAV